MKSLLLSIFVIISLSLSGQNQRIDSLKTRVEINSAKNDFGELFVCYSALIGEYTILNDTLNIVNSTLGMADVSRSGGSHLEALNILNDLHESSYDIKPVQEVRFYQVRGSVYYELNQLDSSIFYAKKGLNVSEENNISKHIPLLYNLLGASYTKINSDTAIYYVQLSIDAYLSRKDTSGVALPYINMARLYTDKNEIKKAESIIFNAIDFLNIKDEPIYRKMAYDFLATLYYNEKNYEQSTKYLILRDSVYYAINSTEIKFHIEQFQFRLNKEKTETERIVLQGKVERAEFENRSKNVLLIFSLVGVVMLGLLLFFVLKSARTRKEANIIIAKKAEELEELNKFKNKVISVISHDMRSPLAQIITLHQAKNSGIKFSETELKEMERSILASTKNGLLILDNLLKWANSQLDGLALRNESFNTQMMLTHILNQVSQMAKEKSIQVESMLSPVEVVADEGLFEIVMRNIFSNAVKFSPENTTVWVSSKVIGDKFEVTVIDEGPGIDDLVISQLEKGETIKSKNGSLGEKGAGIGLSFSMEFAKKMGGDIVCAKLPEKGTKVLFSIPFAKMSKADISS